MTALATEQNKAPTTQPGKSVEDMAQNTATSKDGKSMEDTAQETETSKDTSVDDKQGTNIQYRTETDKHKVKPMESKSLQKAITTNETNNEDKTKGQTDKNKQAQEHNTNPRNSSIQEYTISTRDLDAMEEDNPLQVMYYDWHCLHDKWLNDVMKDKLGAMEGLQRMDFPNIQTMAKPHQVQKIHPTPT